MDNWPCLDVIGLVFKRLTDAGDRDLGIISGGSQGHRCKGKKKDKKRELRIIS